MEQPEQCSVVQSAECTQIAVKKCTKCKIEKPATCDFFSRNKRKRDGMQSSCKECMKKYKDSVKDSISAKNKEWYARNRDLVLKKRSSLYENKKEEMLAKAASDRARFSVRIKKYKLEYARRNKHVLNERKRHREASKKLATPSWYKTEVKKIRDIYKLASESGMHVDHIVPINSDIVCGLHCLSNLQILDPSENISKGNRWWPDMP